MEERQVLTEMLFKRIPNGSIADEIIDRITDALINGALNPGDKIPTEVEFSEKMGVSRNAVREAIKVLVAFGVLEVRRSEGTFVVSDYNPKLMNSMIYGMILSEHTMEELLEYKIVNAYSITVLAMKYSTPESLKEIRRLGEEFYKVSKKTPVSKEEMYNAAVAFNVYIADMARNRMVAQMDRLVHKMSAFTRHKAIEESIARGIPEALPENYLLEVEVLESKDRYQIFELLDKRLQLWRELLL